MAVSRQRMSSYDEKLNVVVVERGQQIFEVGVHRASFSTKLR
jgi:hypothetical protein